MFEITYPLVELYWINGAIVVQHTAIQGPVIVYIIYILLYLGLLNDAIGVVVVCLFVLYVFNIALD